MKKLLKSTVPLVAMLGLFFLTNCKKDSVLNPQNCSNSAEKASTAATNYGTNPTKANCEAYKNAVKDLFKSCPTYYTGATKDALDEFLAEPCPN
ncbi:hypothetical protein DYBT9275_05606 [Dyadobacter sp. CECT 9275]|uniref:Uncharacterized protein n=1 Tax=Dyadobacter helix TaxID=2822344 RepID=A0A916JHW5_9BACT|nr:hypothetical protein [Dyadobacter sp. CECT 9275]CAG5016676.1 hypothetical protein DYBT9275_05606 [Dyadobacter sp. CECT 9275]